MGAAFKEAPGSSGSVRGPRAGWGALTAPPGHSAPVARLLPGHPPPWAQSPRRGLAFAFDSGGLLGGGDEALAARHRSSGSPACLPQSRRTGPETSGRSCSRPAKAAHGGEGRNAPPALRLPTLRPLASPGQAWRPRFFLPSARPSERRRPAGSLKLKRLPLPPPPRRSLPLSSHRRSLHVKPPEWSQGEVGNAATYGGARLPAPGHHH